MDIIGCALAVIAFVFFAFVCEEDSIQPQGLRVGLAMLTFGGMLCAPRLSFHYEIVFYIGIVCAMIGIVLCAVVGVLYVVDECRPVR